MKLLESLFVKQSESDISLEKESLDLLVKSGGLTYIREIQSNTDEITSKIKTMLENDKECFSGGKIALIHFCVHPNAPFEIIHGVLDLVNEYLGDDVADVFWGTTTSKNYELDFSNFGIIIGGIKREF